MTVLAEKAIFEHYCPIENDFLLEVYPALFFSAFFNCSLFTSKVCKHHFFLFHFFFLTSLSLIPLLVTYLSYPFPLNPPAYLPFPLFAFPLCPSAGYFFTAEFRFDAFLFFPSFPIPPPQLFALHLFLLHAVICPCLNPISLLLFLLFSSVTFLNLVPRLPSFLFFFLFFFIFFHCSITFFLNSLF